jgi:oxygen-independent coproporphyrinogen-3 oxidase
VKFIHDFREIFSPEQLQEMTIEVNPGTIAFPQFRQLCQAGFHRISIGIQSLHDAELTLLGRIHNAQEALSCFHDARRAGFENISIDLMFGIPGSNAATWTTTLKQATALHPEHISMYNLTIEEETPFWQQQQQGTLNLPDEDTQLSMYQSGIALLTEAGYEHYEISNFALPGYRSRHNQVYWRNEEYLGLGAGAHSYLKGRRYANTPKLALYCASGESAEDEFHEETPYPPTVVEEECLDSAGTMGETIMMNLRMLDGIKLSAFQQRFGASLESVYAEAIEKLRKINLIEIRDNHLRLTPEGVLLSNEVFQEFIHG